MRHISEHHSKNNQPQCKFFPQNFKWQYTLNNHVRKIHSYATKNSCDMSTQTVLYKQSDIRIISIPEMVIGFIDPTPQERSSNSIHGRNGTSTLNLRETNVDSLIKQLSAKNTRIKKSCGYKKAVAYEKLLNKSKSEIPTLPTAWILTVWCHDVVPGTHF